MHVFFRLCMGLTAGITIGFFLGVLRMKCRPKSYTETQIENRKRLIVRLAAVLKYVTFIMLTIGLIWCIYFLVLGIAVPAQSGYADSMAELIVSVLTVISIMYAVAEFAGRSGGRD